MATSKIPANVSTASLGQFAYPTETTVTLNDSWEKYDFIMLSLIGLSDNNFLSSSIYPKFIFSALQGTLRTISTQFVSQSASVISYYVRVKNSTQLTVNCPNYGDTFGVRVTGIKIN